MQDARLKAPSPGVIFTVGRAILRPLLWLRYRPKVSGTSNIPKDGPVLLASNHLSALDTVLIPSFSSRKVQFLAKESLFSSRIGRWFFPRIGVIAVHRSAGSTAQAALETGCEVLASGKVFAVFPEGSRSPDGRLYNGRGGAAFMALSTGAAVVPVGLIGTSRVATLPATGKSPTMHIRFGQALNFDDLSNMPAGKARKIATERIMHAIAELSEQTPAGELNSGGRD